MSLHLHFSQGVEDSLVGAAQGTSLNLHLSMKRTSITDLYARTLATWNRPALCLSNPMAGLDLTVSRALFQLVELGARASAIERNP